MEQLCVFCEELEFDYDKGGGGCPTCGYGGEGYAEMNCKKGHWNTGIEWDLKDYREKILTGKTCKDYKLVVMTANVKVRGCALLRSPSRLPGWAGCSR